MNLIVLNDLLETSSDQRIIGPMQRAGSSLHNAPPFDKFQRKYLPTSIHSAWFPHSVKSMPMSASSRKRSGKQRDFRFVRKNCKFQAQYPPESLQKSCSKQDPLQRVGMSLYQLLSYWYMSYYDILCPILHFFSEKIEKFFRVSDMTEGVPVLLISQTESWNLHYLNRCADLRQKRLGELFLCVEQTKAKTENKAYIKSLVFPQTHNWFLSKHIC